MRLQGCQNNYWVLNHLLELCLYFKDSFHNNGLQEENVLCLCHFFDNKCMNRNGLDSCFNNYQSTFDVFDIWREWVNLITISTLIYTGPVESFAPYTVFKPEYFSYMTNPMTTCISINIWPLHLIQQHRIHFISSAMLCLHILSISHKTWIGLLTIGYTFNN
jgi:hypothetical protein